jgi:hypothetical protein
MFHESVGQPNPYAADDDERLSQPRLTQLASPTSEREGPDRSAWVAGRVSGASHPAVLASVERIGDDPRRAECEMGLLGVGSIAC